jgi:uncharacterized membrane protein YuzA (DUF378 family)
MLHLDLDTLVTLILIISALNWGLVALKSIDLVHEASMGNADIEKYAKWAIGATGLYALYSFVGKL